MTTNKEACDIYCYDPEKVARIQAHLAPVEARETAQLFKVLADETRYKIAYALNVEGELCGCDLANIIGSSTATVSHHLRILRNTGAVTYRREGKLVFYELTSSRLQQLLGGNNPQAKGEPLHV
ncbi:ArsR/SmtB family transcription factor [Marinococcus halophilus]|uniref:ArsR/SmtB family transcription factor n=1 Tax=Marinococcus halophilus TaxID=1371 RepID=UPI0009A8C249|nr:metalloregulator ArsR/SmtB family transcription factor [Marinococcus halophilus]